jgi:outer membrane protein assembly factor BamB
MTTDHAHLIALNKASGALLWETQMADWRRTTTAPARRSSWTTW